MKKSNVIYNVFSAPEWNSILKLGLELADRFCVVYPNGKYNEENPLLTEKPEFTSLPNLLTGS